MALEIKGIKVALADALPPGGEHSGYYGGFNPSREIVPKGFRKREGNAPFLVDTVLERDISVPMRDGTILRADIFRPVTTDKVPVIICWSPYGKNGNGIHGLHMVPGRFGVPQERLSGFEKFEGLDPAEWVEKGYAIANFDLRGCWDSEGIIPWLGKQDGRDGHDAIEYLAKSEWCSGKVAMAGNSWLAMSQWFIAAQQPPHLAAIAPWEGASDFYRDTLARGGVNYPYNLMWGLLQDTMIGRGKAEAVIAMLKTYPLYNEYWEDKKAQLDRINVPTYVLASYSTSLHTSGSIRGFNEISTSDRWLRIHAKQEWSDLYSPYATDDLCKFFDHYLKGADNGWPQTSKVRIAVLGFNQPSIENVVTSAYPVPQAKQTKLYLADKGVLSMTPTSVPGVETYQSDIIPKGDGDDPEELRFAFRFPRPTWLIGFSKAILHMSAEIADDLDVFVQLQKLDKEGLPLVQLNVPLHELVPPMEKISDVPNTCFLKYYGANGVLRASHSVTKVTTTDYDSWPQYHNKTQKKIKVGEIVRLEIPIWPAGMAFREGESLAVKVSGHYMSPLELENLNGQSTTENKGRHSLYYGHTNESYIEVPLSDPFGV